MPRINTRWFHSQLESQGLTQRKLAQHLRKDPSAISLALKGKRRISLSEATEMARLFCVPIDEVLTQAGIKIHEPKSAKSLSVSGWIDGEFNVHQEPPKGPRAVPVPVFGGKGIRVLRFQTTGTGLDGIDGALVYYKPTGRVDSGCNGKLCVVEIDGGGVKLATVRNGYQSGTFNLSKMDGKLMEESVILDSASPVLWMKF